MIILNYSFLNTTFSTHPPLPLLKNRSHSFRVAPFLLRAHLEGTEVKKPPFPTTPS